VNTTVDLTKQSISLLVNRDESGVATGTLLLDEGISRTEITENDYEYYTVTHSGKSIQFNLSAGTLGK
jgi:hypothetical protein